MSTSTRLAELLKENKKYVLPLVIILILLGLFSTLFLVRKPQDLRNQASVDLGEVDINYFTEPAQFITGQPATVIFTINTHGVEVNGAQLVFDINTQNEQEFVLEPIDDSGLQIFFGPSVVPVESGYRVSAAFRAESETITDAFSNTTDTPFFKLSFQPTQPGSIEFLFDRVSSKVTHAATSQDILKHIQSQSFSIE